jgi:hypothetical protein
MAGSMSNQPGEPSRGGALLRREHGKGGRGGFAVFPVGGLPPLQAFLLLQVSEQLRLNALGHGPAIPQRLHKIGGLVFHAGALNRLDTAAL